MDNELKGEGNSVNYRYRMHDPRVGRFFAPDPLFRQYPHNSPYAFSENDVISHVELEGLEKEFYYDAIESAAQRAKTRTHGDKELFEDTRRRANVMMQLYEQNEYLLSKDETLTFGKYQAYLYAWFVDYGGFTGIENVSVFTEGRTIKGEKAGILDYTFAGVGAIIPFVSSSTIKSIFRVSAETANAKHIARGLDAPFDASKEIFDVVLKKDEQFVRVFSSKLNNKTGDFLVKAEEIKGLTPVQIKNRLALDYVPDMMVDVNVPSGTTLRGGVAAERKSVNAAGGGNQVQLQERIDESNFTNARKLE